MIYCIECFTDLHKVMSNAHLPVNIYEVGQVKFKRPVGDNQIVQISSRQYLVI